ncbi:MAG: hypothetical protein ACE148_10370 [Vicinamibacterales bacterium]
MRSTHPSEDVTVYGDGEPGGKGAGLIAVNGWRLPCTSRLPTMILATGFYDRYLERGCRLCGDDFIVLSEILQALGERPIGVRSSATDEAWSPGEGRTIHAGENLSFMLPNNHEDRAVRLRQLALAVQHVYDDFHRRHGPGSSARMGIVINPIPGLFDDTAAGPFYYPYVSGVADSFFPYALKSQDPREGYGRIAFGHGYATVLDDFPVIQMATIRNPLPLNLLQTGRGQQFFYALDLTKNWDLQGDELETMKKLHVRHASFHRVRLLGVQGQIVTIENLVQQDQFGFRTSLARIMEEIGSRSASNFQIEFVFNLDFRRKPCREGTFHVVQLTCMPKTAWDPIEMPAGALRTYLCTSSLQGHGVRRGIRYAVVVSPFLYSKDQHDAVRRRLAEINRGFLGSREEYILVVPGRLGSRNRDWGIHVEYGDVSQAAAIFEYGVDIAGRVQPLPEESEMTGGTYGSHFLYVVLGGYSEDQRRLQARMHGTQGTHFFTNLMSGNVVYAYVSPTQDSLDPWFFSPPAAGEAVYVLTFPRPASVFADAIRQRCLVVEEAA